MTETVLSEAGIDALRIIVSRPAFYGAPAVSRLVQLCDSHEALRRQVAQLTARVTVLEQGQVWQPIETAPKDGQWFLIWQHWSQYPAAARWFEPWACWVLASGSEADTHQAHWRPLPAPPTGGAS